MGCPWAGHNNSKLYLTGRMNQANLSSLENVGGLEPTGSGWYRFSLSRTRETDFLVVSDFKPG